MGDVQKPHCSKTPGEIVDFAMNDGRGPDVAKKLEDEGATGNRATSCAKLSKITVATTVASNTQKRKWNKPQYCVFCKEKKSKMGRHLFDQHAEKSEVAAIMAITPNKKLDAPLIMKSKKQQRNDMLAVLRKRGNYDHNIKVIDTGEGEIVTEKRPDPTHPHPHTDYLPCETCFGFYHKNDLRKHRIKCPERRGSHVPARVQGDASMLLSDGQEASARLQSYISKMIVDDVSRCIKSDPLICSFGNKLCQKLRKQGDQQHYVCNKLRELGRFVLEVRQCCENVTRMEDCIAPQRFKFLIQAVTDLCGWDDLTETISKPSVGIKLGHSLTKCAKLLRRNAMEGRNRVLKRECEDFIDLMKDNWNDEISRASRDELNQRKWNKPTLLPLTADLQVLSKHLKQVITSSLASLANDAHDIDAYRDILTAVLSLKILFNRKRAGEPAKMTIDDYNKSVNGEKLVNDEVKKSLSEFEVKVCNQFKRVEMRGKRGRKVPLLITYRATARKNKQRRGKHTLQIFRSIEVPPR